MLTIVGIRITRSAPEGLPPAPVLTQEGVPLDVDAMLKGVEIPELGARQREIEIPKRRTGSEWAEHLNNLVQSDEPGKAGRNHGLHRLAGLLFLKLPAELAYELLHAVNESRCKPPLERSEVDQLASSAARKEAHRRRLS